MVKSPCEVGTFRQETIAFATPFAGCRPSRSCNQRSAIMEVCPPQVDRKLWNRFYEPLVLLSAYGKSQGKGFKSDREWRFGAPDHGHGALCMKFLDELAYICDYAPGGDTVAAIAIEDGCGPTYWVSANKNQAAKVKPFLNGVLSLLASAHGKGKLHDGKLEQQVTNQIISFSARRLRHYRHMLQKAVQACLSDLGMESAKGCTNCPRYEIILVRLLMSSHRRRQIRGKFSQNLAAPICRSNPRSNARSEFGHLLSIMLCCQKLTTLQYNNLQGKGG